MTSKTESKQLGSSTLTLAAVVVASTLASVSFFMTGSTFEGDSLPNETGCERSQLVISSANYSASSDIAQARIRNPANVSLKDIKVSLFTNGSLTRSKLVPNLDPGATSAISFKSNSTSEIVNSSQLPEKLTLMAIPLHCPTLKSSESLRVE